MKTILLVIILLLATVSVAQAKHGTADVLLAGQSNAFLLKSYFEHETTSIGTPISYWDDKDVTCDILVWIQGERDARDSNYNYASDLEALVERSGAKLVVLARLSDYHLSPKYSLDSYPLWEGIREVQEELCTEHGWILIDTDDISMMRDDIHFDAGGRVELLSRIKSAIWDNYTPKCEVLDYRP